MRKPRIKKIANSTNFTSIFFRDLASKKKSEKKFENFLSLLSSFTKVVVTDPPYQIDAHLETKK